MKSWTGEINELETLLKSMKGFIPHLEKELEHIVKTDDENMALVYARRCLEVIVTDLCEKELHRPRKTEPLKGIIDKLNHEEKVPSHIIASMLNLNSLSTFGAHPKEFDPQQVRLVLINLTTIIRWYLKYKNINEEITTEETEIKKPDKITEPVPVSKHRNKSVIIIPAILLAGIILVFALDLFNIFRKDRFENIRDPEGKISIAVMPFENLTGDSSLYFWQNGISEFLINGLGNSEELAVISSRVISEVFESSERIHAASISPSLARETAKRVKAGTYITGNFLGTGNNVSIMVNLVNTETDELIWSNKIDGDLENNYRHLLDSLSGQVKNFLEIKVLKEKADYDLMDAFPNSAEAYRHYIDGLNSIVAYDHESAIESLTKALEIDSNFTFAAFYLAWAYNYNQQFKETCEWTKRAYELKNNLPSKYHPWINLWYACFITEDVNDIRKYCDQLGKSDLESRFVWFDLGITYSDWLREYEKCIKAYEKVAELNEQWGNNWKYNRYYQEYCWVLLMADRPREVNRIKEKGLEVDPEDGWLKLFQGSSHVMLGDTTAVQNSISEIRSIVKKYNQPESVEEHFIGLMYLYGKDTLKAEEHYRKAYNLDPENPDRMANLSNVLIRAEINIEEGLALAQKGLEKNPESTGSLWRKGLALHKLGKHEEALALLKEVDECLIGYNIWLQDDIKEVEKAISRKNR
jgi:tetratricopeptide (TPR) repeat protein